MNTRPRSGSLVTSPVLVGAITVVIVIVAVFLAYNANQGLPFTPTYDVTAKVPNSANLVNGNDVRVAGFRVGTIKTIEPYTDPETGETAALLHLKLDTEMDPLPEDTVLTVRNQSTIGLKYLQLELGTSPQGFQDGDEIPITSLKPESVDLDQFFNTFDEPTRRANQAALRGFGDALAGRGAQLNGGLAELRNLIEVAQPVTNNLADPDTRFGGFFRALEDISATVAPVAEQQAELFGGLDATFGAFARTARPYIQETIEKGAPTQDAAIEAFPVMRPFLDHSATFFTSIQPGVDALANSANDYAVGTTAGVPALRAVPRFNAELVPTAQTVLDFQNTPGVNNGLDLLVDTNNALASPLAYIAPSQTVCNYLALLFRNVASMGAPGDGLGTWQRVVTFTTPPGPNSQGSPSSAPANGPASVVDQQRRPTNYLHYNPYPNTAAPGQLRECEAGNEPYTNATIVGNPPGNQGTNTDEQTDPKEKKKKKKAGKKDKTSGKGGGK